MIKDNKINLRDSGVVYRSVVEKVLKLYSTNKDLGGELAVAVLQMCLSETTTSDNPMIELLLSEYKVTTERDHKRHDDVVRSRRDSRRQDLQLDTIAELYFVQRLTQRQIAEQLDTTQQNISKRLKTIKSDYPELIPNENTTNTTELTTEGVVQPYNQYNQYVYDYEYEYEYDYDYDYEYDNNSSVVQPNTIVVQQDNIVDSKTGEILAKVNEANYEREDYWDNVTNPIFELQEDPTLATALAKYPNYLTLPMLGADNSFPNGDGWAFPPNGAAREQQHLDAAALGYRLCKLEK